MGATELDVVRRMVEAYLSADLQTALSLLHPDVLWHGTIGGLEEGTTARGHEEVAAAFAESAETWETLSIEPTRFVDAGDRVVVIWHEVARSRHSETELETETGVIYRVADGQVVEVQGYMDPAAALAAAGL
jgi:ketosteroid isomerase-like protein